VLYATFIQTDSTKNVCFQNRTNFPDSISEVFFLIYPPLVFSRAILFY